MNFTSFVLSKKNWDSNHENAVWFGMSAQTVTIRNWRPSSLHCQRLKSLRGDKISGAMNVSLAVSYWAAHILTGTEGRQGREENALVKGGGVAKRYVLSIFESDFAIFACFC